MCVSGREKEMEKERGILSNKQEKEKEKKDEKQRYTVAGTLK